MKSTIILTMLLSWILSQPLIAQQWVTSGNDVRNTNNGSVIISAGNKRIAGHDPTATGTVNSEKVYQPFKIVSAETIEKITFAFNSLVSPFPPKQVIVRIHRNTGGSACGSSTLWSREMTVQNDRISVNNLNVSLTAGDYYLSVESRSGSLSFRGENGNGILYTGLNCSKISATLDFGIYATRPDVQQKALLHIDGDIYTNDDIKFGDGSSQNTAAFNIWNQQGQTIHYHGRVGMGISSPQTNLSVKGKIRGAYDAGETEYTEIGHGGGHGYINTVGDGTLAFRHDQQTRMSLTSSGNLGIGTTAPNSKLHVVGDMHGGAIQFQRSADAPLMGIRSYTYNETTDRMIFYTDIASNTFPFELYNGKAKVRAKLEVEQNNRIQLGNAFVSSGILENHRMAHFGNLGWYDGTQWHFGNDQQPSSLLQFYDGEARFIYHGGNGMSAEEITVPVSFDMVDSVFTAFGFQLRNPSNGIELANIQLNNNLYGIKIFKGSGSMDLQAQTSDGAKMELRAKDQNGMRTILLGRSGDPRNDQQTIVVGKLVIDDDGILEGPDYVFADDYKLLSLEETEAFISANKHLPNFPGASEYEGNFNVQMMSFKLIEKIEELTLHTIAQQKEIRDQQEGQARLKEELTRQSAEIAWLKKQIERLDENSSR